MHIAIVTAGGAGMFCGSCMHDNTWAKALQDAGHEVSLIPTYTPIRVDEQNLSVSEVFLGGINVYLDYRLPLWRKIPRPLVRWLDSPRVIRWATKFGVSNDAAQLGPLTLAMLDGEEGPNRREINEFADFVKDLAPDVIVFSNALLVGVVRTLRERLGDSVKIFCMLQGDDIFLMDLLEKFRTAAIAKIHERCRDFDGFLTHSHYYRDYMANLLDLPIDRFHRVPLGIDVSEHDGLPTDRENEHFTIGYFARICPEKGLHNLVNAFQDLHERQPKSRLVAAGYLGKRDRKYLKGLLSSAASKNLPIHYAGSPDSVTEKVALFKSFDVLSVPTDYHEPKGLPVLEALANGTPVVQPRHGAFPELIETTGGGLLFEPTNTKELADQLQTLVRDKNQRLALAKTGYENVRKHYTEIALAEESVRIFARQTEVVTGSTSSIEPTV
ncbi:glycosyltransferase family 4 protein [Thalassoroseus pseudoceratinae]|uniref:glycosyltransferase family 4 protein n=1 Tax=Thalassoroseus pseudoceratinae TaxID=2713176 RepID=UPI00141ED4C6|nr:glycosyltransferase family 4 protein [Thalassoroseus pseudoceratinae]